MSYYAYGVDGYLGDVATITGWNEFADWAEKQDGALAQFAAEGYTHDAPALRKQLLATNAGVPDIDSVRTNLATIASKAGPEGCVIVNNGEDSSEEPKQRGVAYLEFKYSEDQPRDEHGRWTSGGGSEPSKISGHPSERQGATREHIREAITSELARQGMGSYPVHIRDDVPMPNGVHDFETLAWYNPDNKFLSFFLPNMDGVTAKGAAGIARHEAAHVRFDHAREVARKFVANNLEALKREDGTTPYARSIWKGAAAKRGFWPANSAVDESLSEMYKTGNFKPTYAKLAKIIETKWARSRWAHYYKVVTVKYSEDQARDDHGRWASEGAGSTHHNPSESTDNEGALTQEQRAGLTSLITDKLASMGMADFPVNFLNDPSRLPLEFALAGVTPVAWFEPDKSGEHGRLNFVLSEVHNTLLGHKNDPKIMSKVIEHEATHARMSYANSQSADVLKFIENNANDLKKEDGTTPYARSYWKQVDPAPETYPVSRLWTSFSRTATYNGSALVHAVGESLAEMRGFGKMQPTYAKLDKLIDHEWSRSKYGKKELKYSEDQPRDDHGRWTSDGGGSSEVSPYYKPRSDSDLSRYQGSVDMIKATLEKMGLADYPQKYVSDPAHDRQLARLGPGALAYFNPQSGTGGVGRLVFNLKEIENGALSLPYILAHETSHVRLYYANNKSDVLNTFIRTNLAALEREDGTTDYSKTWWRRAGSGAVSLGTTGREHALSTLAGALTPTQRDASLNSGYLHAVNETLAEMNATNRFTPTYGKLNAIVNARWARSKWGKAAARSNFAKALKYSEDQPRDDHGRWTSEGGGEGKPPEIFPFFRPHQESIPDSQQVAATRIRNALDKIGLGNFPVQLVTDPRTNREMSGEHKGTLAYFSPQRGTGGIGQLYFNLDEFSRNLNIPDNTPEMVVAHEATHIRMSYANNKGDEVLKFMRDNAGALKFEDGTTAYARSWWSKPQVGTSTPPEATGDRDSILTKSWFAHAVGESLAEMEAQRAIKHIDYKPTYAKLAGIIDSRWSRSKWSKDLSPWLAKYSPDQPRDDDGKWTNDGGSGDQKPSPLTAPAPAKPPHDLTPNESRGSWAPASPAMFGFEGKFSGKAVDAKKLSPAEVDKIKTQLADMRDRINAASREHGYGAYSNASNAIAYATAALDVRQGYRRTYSGRVAMDHGTMRGGALFHAVDKDTVELDYLGSFQRGAGSTLLSEVEKEAAKTGHTMVRLTSTAYAQNFYKAHGFEARFGKWVKTVQRTPTQPSETLPPRIWRSADGAEEDEPLGVLALSDELIEDVRSKGVVAVVVRLKDGPPDEARDDHGRWTDGGSGDQKPSPLSPNKIGENWTPASPAMFGFEGKFSGKAVDVNNLSESEKAAAKKQLEEMRSHIQASMRNSNANHAISYVSEVLKPPRSRRYNGRLAMEEDGTVRGGALFHGVDRDTVELDYLGSFQRGAGSTLLSEVEKEAAKTGHTKIRLNSTEYAKDFYKAHGFVNAYDPSVGYNKWAKTLDQATTPPPRVRRRSTDGIEEEEEPLGVLALSHELIEDVRSKDVIYLEKYSEDQPRDDHGRWTSEGGGDHQPQPEGAIAPMRPESMATNEEMAKVEEVARDEMDKQGMGSYDLNVYHGTVDFKQLGWTGPEFQNYSALGYFDPDMNAINVMAGHPEFRTADWENKVRGTVAHESAHARYQYARSDVDIASYVKSNLGQLAGEDGVSDYSKAWWQRATPYEGRPPLAYVRQAVNETLAEISRYKSDLGDKPHYAELSKMVDAAWAKSPWAPRKAAVVRLKAGPEDEPRDDHGRWTSGGGGDFVTDANGREEPSNPAYTKWAKGQAEQLGKWSINEQEALRDYTASGYVLMNEYLRNNYDKDPPKTNAVGMETWASTGGKVKNLEGALEKSTIGANVVSYRAVSRNDLVERLDKGNAIGVTLVDPAFKSGTLENPWKWTQVPGKTTMVIRNRPATKGAYVASLSSNSDEREILYPPSTKFIIRKVDKSGERYTVHVDPVQ